MSEDLKITTVILLLCLILLVGVIVKMTSILVCKVDYVEMQSHSGILVVLTEPYFFSCGIPSLVI